MPRVTKKVATLASLVDDSMSDDELAYTLHHNKHDDNAAPAMPTPDSAAEEKHAATRKRSASGKSNAIAKAKKQVVEKDVKHAKGKGKRSALDDVTNVDDQESAKKRVKSISKAPVVTHKARKPLEVEQREIVVEQDETTGQHDHEEEQENIEASIEEVPIQQVIPTRRMNSAPVRSQSHVRPIARGNSRALSMERSVGDAALRRRLGDITSKYDSLEVKYQQLKETASVDAQSSFDKLKSASERQAKGMLQWSVSRTYTNSFSAQDHVIASLRKQLAATQDLVIEARTLRNQLAAGEAENQRLKDDTRKSVAEIKSLKEASTKAQNDIKALQAKLAASRGHSEQPQMKGPGKNAASSSNASQAMASLKEDLYCDITGLLIHSVKKTDKRTVYDCSQTGRNGSKSERVLLLCFFMTNMVFSTAIPVHNRRTRCHNHDTRCFNV